MTDLRNLHDAFAELERRADAASAGLRTPAPRPRRAVRLVPVAATVVAVAGLAAGAMWLAPGDNSGTQAGSPPTTSSAPPTTEPKGPVPTSPDDLIARFRVVLGDTATFEVKDTAGGPVQMTVPPSSAGSSGGAVTLPQPNVETSVENMDRAPGAFINGTLTSAGVKGGFDLQIYAGTPGDEAFCDDPDRASCQLTTLPDGSKLALASEPLQDAGGVTYMANLVRPDGTVLLMHVSNQQDPKSAGEIYAPQPPLSLEQLSGIVTSDKW